MVASFLQLAVYLCLGCIAFSQDVTLTMYPPPENLWYEVDSDVKLECTWEHNSGDRVVVDWKYGGNGIRKITEGDEENTYIYGSSVFKKERQQEFHDFAEEAADDAIKTQFSELTIVNITLADPKVYYCYVELGSGVRDDNTEFTIHLYELPTVSAVDKVISVDIRPPIETPTTAAPEEESSNGTETVPDYTSDYMSDEAAEVTEQQQIEIECRIEGAYPKPTVVFTVGEGGEEIEAGKVNWTSGSDNEPYSGVALLKLDANPKYDGKTVSCSAKLPTQPEPTTVKGETTSSLIEILHDVTEVTTTIVNGVSISGDEVEIRCGSDGNPKPTFSVQSDVSEKPDFEMSSDGRTFTIRSVIKGDAGKYWCLATLPPRSGDYSESNTMESVNKETLKVHYIEDPTLSENQDIVLQLDGSQGITCNANADPQSIPIWKKDGREISSNSNLQIDMATYENEGTYTCETKNDAGTTSKSINIRVEGACKATFKTLTVTGSSTTRKAYNVKLECEATGKPACTVNIVPQSGSGITGESKENGKVLEFSALPLLSAPVMFFCIAENSGGKSNVSVTLGEDSEVCCAAPQTAGLSTGAIIGIIVLVLAVIIGIPVACYFVKKRNAAQTNEKSGGDAEEGEAEKEGLNKEASSEDSDTGSLPPPPADTDNDHRLNHGTHEMTTFSTNQ